MSYLEKFKSRRQKWLEYSLIFAIIIIVIGALALSSDDKELDVENDEEDGDYSLLLFLFSPFILYLVIKSRNKNNELLTDGEIINFVADSIYKEKGVYLNTSLDNVRVQRGAPDETYVQFIDMSVTYLYTGGIGITERYPGESIKSIKKGKQEDKITMKLAEIGIARKKHLENLESYGLTEEER